MSNTAIQAAIAFLESDDAKNLMGLHRVKVGGHLMTRGDVAQALTDTQSTTFVQPKITGYRQLSEVEVQLMNEVKAKSEEVGELLRALCQPGTQADRRWVELARDQLQMGFMALVRSVAKPSTF